MPRTVRTAKTAAVKMYGDYVRVLQKRFHAALSSIEAKHNFDYGAEFEIALCRILRAALPDRFGICRGHVVDRAGSTAGDDILIFERSRFPTLLLRDHDDYSRKELVPIEAVYCYIEAKHTLNLEGDGPASLYRASLQVSAAANLIATREVLIQLESQPKRKPLIPAPPPLTSGKHPDFPFYLNPSLGVIFARFVCDKRGKRLLGQQVLDAIAANRTYVHHRTDLLVLGADNVIVPVLARGKRELVYQSPFYLEERSQHAARYVPDLAFGVGLLSILYALNTIQLGVMPWHDLVSDALNAPVV